jgi:hypothetical protein
MDALQRAVVQVLLAVFQMTGRPVMVPSAALRAPLGRVATSVPALVSVLAVPRGSARTHLAVTTATTPHVTRGVTQIARLVVTIAMTRLMIAVVALRPLHEV